MRKSVIVVFLAIITVLFCCTAEDFFAPVSKKKSVGNLKQTVAQSMVESVQLASKNIELIARAQQLMYQRIEELAQGDKKSTIGQLSRQELHAAANALQETTSKMLAHQQMLLEFIQQLQAGFKKSQVAP